MTQVYQMPNHSLQTLHHQHQTVLSLLDLVTQPNFQVLQDFLLERVKSQYPKKQDYKNSAKLAFDYAYALGIDQTLAEALIELHPDRLKEYRDKLAQDMVKVKEGVSYAIGD